MKLAKNVFTVLFVLLVLLVSSCAGQEETDEVVLDADKVTYDEQTGIGTAEGNARLVRGNMTLDAPYMNVDSTTSVVKAYSEPDKPVTITQGRETLRGSSLEYDLQKREGTMYGGYGTMPADKGYVYMDGGRIDIAPEPKAAEKEWIHGTKPKEEDEETFVAQWKDVTITTCPEDPPHYRLVTYRMVIIPERSVIAKTPDVYMGKHKLFRYPFDYIVDLRKKEHTPFMPSLIYDSDKGIGLGIKPRFYPDDNSTLDLTLRQWSDEGSEWKGRYTRSLGGGFSIFGETAYEFDYDIEKKEYRPSWGAQWRRDGWTSSLIWSQREPRDTIRRSGEIYKTTLWRNPEFSIRSPWWDDPVSPNTKWSLSGSWGEYEERQKVAERTSLGLHLRGGESLGEDVSFYWRGNYRYYDYDSGETQDTTDVLLGLRYSVSSISFNSSYFKRWTYGRSPLWWDDYDDNEMAYQQVGFPVYKDLSFKFRTSYNLYTEQFDERIYEFTIDKDCMKWIFMYRDHLVESENDDWAAVRLIIKAFPDTDIAIDSRAIDSSYKN
jgi:LPS-assembly protein